MDKMITCDEELSDSDDEGDKRRDNQIHKVRRQRECALY